MFFKRMRVFFVALWLVMALGCSKTDVVRNPNLGEIRFSRTINLNLPLYNALKNPQSTIFIPEVGIKGVFITNRGDGSFWAWEAACPNHVSSECEAMRCATREGDSFKDCEDRNTTSYIFVRCKCDESVYNLINGNHIFTTLKKAYPLLNYRVSKSGENLITISN